jgi:hypothetical protein
MTSIYFALIIFPIIFMVAMAYIYASSLTSIAVEQIKLNCPYPLNSAVGSNVNIVGSTVTYDVVHDNSTGDYHVTVFHCGEGDTVNVYTTIYTTANNWFNIGTGYLFYISEMLDTFFLKVIALGTLIPLFINAPAEVLAIPEYTYVNAVLIAFVLLGGFMVVRG